MKIKYLKCDWGMENFGNPKERLKMYKNAGYDGVECANIGMDAQEFADYTDELGLEYVAMVFCDFNCSGRFVVSELSEFSGD